MRIGRIPGAILRILRWQEVANEKTGSNYKSLYLEVSSGPWEMRVSKQRGIETAMWVDVAHGQPDGQGYWQKRILLTFQLAIYLKSTGGSAGGKSQTRGRDSLDCMVITINNGNLVCKWLEMPGRPRSYLQFPSILWEKSTHPRSCS